LLIRRACFERVGGFETEFRGLYEDQVFLSKMALHFPMVVIPDVLDHYRQHPASACSRGIESGDYDPNGLHPARRRYLFWLETYCDERSIDNRRLRRALNRELWPYRSAFNASLHRIRHRAPEPFRRAIRRVLPWELRFRVKNLGATLVGRVRRG
jgi:hypothetical protein